MYIFTWSFRYAYKLKTIYSSKMVIQYSLPRISLISSYIITNKALILSIFWKQRSSYFPAKKIPHKVRKTEINTAIVSHTCKFGCNILITTETLLINNIAELVIITEVKFIKKFLHAVGENCHGNKKVYIVNHKGNVHGKQSLMIFISSFSSCVPLLSQFRKPVGTVSCFVKVQRGLRDNTILHRQKRLLSFKTTILCIS